MRILIIEYSLAGHHGPYLNWIISALRDAGNEIVLAVHENVKDHPLFSMIASTVDTLHQFSGSVSDTFGRPDQSNTQMWQVMLGFRRMFGNVYAEVARQGAVDRVFLPYLDYCTYAFAVLGAPFGCTPWSGIVMRPTFHFANLGIKAPAERMAFVKKYMFGRLLRDKSLDLLFTIDESFAAYWGHERVKRLRLLRDPVREPVTSCVRSFTDMRNSLGIPNEALLIVCYGSIARRKGICELLLALSDVNCPKAVHVLIAGMHEPDVTDLFESELVRQLAGAGRLWLINHFVSDADERRILVSADVMWAGYVGHVQMSASLVHAGVYRMPVVACDEGLIGWHTRRHTSGIVVDVGDTAAVVRALKGLYESPRLRQQLGNNGHRAFAAHEMSVVARDLAAAMAETGRENMNQGRLLDSNVSTRGSSA